jgi:plasmid stabilization system protein ParE
VRVVTGILETIITLSSQPKAGAPAEQFGEGVRKFAAGKYIIYYRLRAAKAVEILHVFHGARDQEKAWQGGEGKPR